MNEDEVMTVSEVAELLKCSSVHITRLCKGRVPVKVPIPFFRFGGRVSFRRDSITEWMKKCEAAETGEVKP